MSSICLGIHGFSVILFQSVVLGGLLLYVGGFYTCVSLIFTMKSVAKDEVDFRLKSGEDLRKAILADPKEFVDRPVDDVRAEAVEVGMVIDREVRKPRQPLKAKDIR